MRLRTIQGIVLGLALGAVLGVGGYTFIYAKGYSYMTNNPGACANCHVMQDYYDGWLKSSHRSVAVCNDCHTPPGFVGKYMTKASNGFWHSFYFTTGNYPEPLRITRRNHDITEQACRKCHQEVVEAIDTQHQQTGETSCVRCHSTVGHLR
ncbi:MAG TPA: cytochrome c nitrite reductase small subunit [Pyrinomonadaceae bacterium]|nr:cytochrome c nitrite reductase small subunit [Pyrinomonadaceae bacterium]